MSPGRTLDFLGERAGTRTQDLLIKSQLHSPAPGHRVLAAIPRSASSTRKAAIVAGVRRAPLLAHWKKGRLAPGRPLENLLRDQLKSVALVVSVGETGQLMRVVGERCPVEQAGVLERLDLRQVA